MHFKCALIARSVAELGKIGESVGVPHLGSRKYFVTASVSSKGVNQNLIRGECTVPVC